ncbi:tRNA1(Val) (adenine(37)-N6)-methyltransferase [Phaeobacter sp. HF9A]|uniref:tRNA1(Val) (adenine(37)-N6)-methyltransferase n=1 Tax=Phaeobacter sp. HF9A TaxID=2721561 RepID=UPI0034C6757B
MAEPAVFAAEELSSDGFLGGKLTLMQPKSGYRAGVDPVLLAASVNARPGQRVLELGCGAGQAMLCLAARVADLALTGVELQPAYADLARRNAAANGREARVWTADLADLPAELRQQSFDHVIANPPYYRPGAHSPAQDAGRATALGEGTPLDLWFDAAARRLAPKGYLHMIQRADRLPDMIAAVQARLGSLEVLPLAPRAGRAAELVLLRARKGGRAAFRLHAPLVLHDGAAHLCDGEDYSPAIRQVLRAGAALPWPAA